MKICVAPEARTELKAARKEISEKLSAVAAMATRFEKLERRGNAILAEIDRRRATADAFDSVSAETLRNLERDAELLRRQQSQAEKQIAEATELAVVAGRRGASTLHSIIAPVVPAIISQIGDSFRPFFETETGAIQAARQTDAATRLHFGLSTLENGAVSNLSEASEIGNKIGMLLNGDCPFGIRN